MRKISGQKLFNYFFALVSVFVFVMVCIRSAVIPFAHDEVATFFYYIQTGNFLPYHSHADADNHVLNSCLSWICFKLSGDSPFSLRLPNLMALLVLAVSVYRISKQLIHAHSRLILLAGFLLSFYWLSFFSLCRGYGISLSFLILSLYYLVEYFNSKELKKLVLFYLFVQIALSAHLVLIILAIGLTFAVIIFQLLNKKFTDKRNLTILIIHLLLILFWVKFSFFLQGKNLLYGDAQNYWNTTFVALIQLLSGSTAVWIPFFMVFCFLVLTGVAITINIKKIQANILNIYAPSIFFTLMLAGMIVAFYAMHVIFNINYPEDRHGLFFYVLFILALAFTADRFKGTPVKALSAIIAAGALVHFILTINFRKHVEDCYQTLPGRFYTRLMEEEKASPERITIGGQPETEFIYDFTNYRHNGDLNNMNISLVKLSMNCDYVITMKNKEHLYEPYYAAIDSDKNWGITLLKRREKIKRNLLASVDSLKTFQTHDEFYNLYALKDTGFKNTNPLLIEININRIQAEMPLQAWLVFEIDSTGGDFSNYQRMPLNWIRYNWSGVRNQKLDLVSAQLPKKVRRLVFYLWNLKKKAIKCEINSVKIYQLDGNNVNVSFSYKNRFIP